MPPHSQQNLQVHECTFQAHIEEVDMIVKFPCKLFVLWKQAFDQQITRTKNPNVTVLNNIATFNQIIAFKTFMIFEKQTQTYQKKQTDLVVVLTPSRKPNEENFIGRVSVSLSDVMTQRYISSQKYELQYGSAKNRFLSFTASLISKQIIDKKPNQIKLDSFQILSLPQPKKLQENQKPIEIKKQSIIKRFSTTQDKKIPQSPQKKPKKNVEEEENRKVEQVKKKPSVNRSNREVEELRNQNQQLKQKLATSDKKLINLEEEKDVITEELLNQIKQKTQECISLQNLLKQSEDLRLAHEIQNLQLKYQLSNIKEGELPSTNKEQQIKNLKSYIDDLQLLKEENEKEFNKKIGILNKEKNNLQEHLMAMEKDRERFQMEKKNLEAQLMKAQGYDLEEVQERILELQNQSNKFKSSLKLSQNENSHLKDKIKELQIKNINLHERCLQAQTKLQKLTEFKKTQLAEKQLQLNSLKKIYQQKNHQLQSIKDKLSLVSQAYDNVSMQKKKSQTQIRKLQNNLKSSQKEKDEEQNKKKNLNLQFQQMNKIRTELINRNLMLENEIKGYEVKLEKVNNELKNRDETIKQRKIYTDILTKQVQEEIKNNHDLQEKLTKFAEKQIKMKQNILILEEESRKIYDIVLEKQQSEEYQSQYLIEREEEIAQLKIQLNDTQFSLEKVTEENAQIKKQLYDLKKQAITKPQNELYDAQSDRRYDQMLKLNRKRIEELQNQKEQLIFQTNHKQEQMKKKCQKLQYDRNKQKQKITTLEGEKSQLKKQKNQLIQSNKWLQHAMKESENKIEQMEHEIQRMINKNKKKKTSEEQDTLKRQNLRLSKKLEENQSKLQKQKNISNQYQQKIQELEMKKYAYSPAKKIASDINLEELISTIQNLKKVIEQRSQKQQPQATIELLLAKITAMQEGYLSITKERGIIQEMARKLSMEVQKIKASVMKGKTPVLEKKQLISSFKASDDIIKNLIQFAENLSQVNIEEYD